MICEQPALPPGIVHRTLRGDLDTMVLKALEKDRAKRYQSADALGRDLRCFLRGERVSVRPPNRFDLAAAWVRRHSIIATACACALMIMLTAAGLSLGLWFFGMHAARVELRDGNSRVALKSRSDIELHGWDLRGANSAIAAYLVEPKESGLARRIVVIGATQAAQWKYGSSVCIFDLDQPDEPLWTSAASPLVQPAGEPDRSEAQFIVERVMLADVFAECPGREIVMTQRLSQYSACAISVFNLSC